MTRRSKRELERALDDLTARESSEELVVVHEDPKTGEWFDGIGEGAEPIDRGEFDGEATVVVLRDVIVETGWQEDGLL